MGVFTGVHLGLAGAAVTFLVRPHREEQLSRPQVRYSHDDHSLKTFSGYDGARPTAIPRRDRLRGRPDLQRLPKGLHAQPGPARCRRAPRGSDPVKGEGVNVTYEGVDVRPRPVRARRAALFGNWPTLAQPEPVLGRPPLRK